MRDFIETFDGQIIASKVGTIGAIIIGELSDGRGCVPYSILCEIIWKNYNRLQNIDQGKSFYLYCKLIEEYTELRIACDTMVKIGERFSELIQTFDCLLYLSEELGLEGPGGNRYAYAVTSVIFELLNFDNGAFSFGELLDDTVEELFLSVEICRTNSLSKGPLSSSRVLYYRTLRESVANRFRKHISDEYYNEISFKS